MVAKTPLFWDTKSKEWEYENLVSKTVTGLMKIYAKLGRPEADIKNNTFWLMIDQIVNIWSVVFPDQVKDLEHDVQLERSIEQSLQQSVKSGLKAGVKYPDKLYAMIKVFFPELSLADKEFTTKFISRYPNFNASNYT